MQAYTINNEYKAWEKTILTPIFKIARTAAHIILGQKYANILYQLAALWTLQWVNKNPIKAYSVA